MEEKRVRWAEETEEHQGSPDSVEKVESALYLSGGAKRRNSRQNLAEFYTNS